ncbi:BAH domain-containing protein [Metarhizium brunneum]
MAPRSRKRRRSSNEDRRGGCPFTVTTITERRSNRASKKSKQDDANMEERQWTQLWPFNPEGKFNSMQSMSLPYIVEPRKRWRAMTRYHNFILNGRKYSTHDFVYVANDDSIETQKIASRVEDGGSLPRLTKYWVAKILEIRAADEHHVYARIYWMYSPDELPPNTRYGEESIEGRQTYHGKNELIASNHMDVINVISIVTEAQVHQWIESNDDEVRDALYWRQAFNIATLQLSPAELVCNCQTPAHPDELLVGCTSQDCGQWLHEKCLRHAVLKQVYDRVGTEKPHSSDINSDMTATPTQIAALSSGADGAKDISNPFPSKLGKFASSELYDGLFTATLITGNGPLHWEITDQRLNCSGNTDTWKELVACLTCGTAID